MRTNYSDSKDLVQKTISDKILKVRAYEVDRNPNYNKYQRRVATIVYEIFDNKAESGAKATVYEDLDQELHKTEKKKKVRKKKEKNSERRKSMPGLKILFRQQIQLKWDHYLLKIEVFNIYYMWQMFSPKKLGSNL